MHFEKLYTFSHHRVENVLFGLQQPEASSQLNV